MVCLQPSSSKTKNLTPILLIQHPSKRKTPIPQSIIFHPLNSLKEPIILSLFLTNSTIFHPLKSLKEPIILNSQPIILSLFLKNFLYHDLVSAETSFLSPSLTNLDTYNFFPSSNLSSINSSSFLPPPCKKVYCQTCRKCLEGEKLYVSKCVSE